MIITFRMRSLVFHFIIKSQKDFIEYGRLNHIPPYDVLILRDTSIPYPYLT